MISGLVLKYLNGECFVIRRGYETTLPVSSSFCLTVPRARFHVPEWSAFCHTARLRNRPPRLKLVLSDSTTDATGVDYVIFYYYDEANIQRKGSISFSNNSIVMECDSGSVRELQSPCAHCMRIFSIIASQAQSSALFRPSSGLCPSQAISPGPITTVFKPSPAKNPASVPNGTFVVPK